MDGILWLGVVDTEDKPSARRDGGRELPFYFEFMHQS